MRTLHPGLRVTNIERSLAFYAAIGYEVVGRVAGTSIGALTLLKLPDDEFAALELVEDPTQLALLLGNGLTHLAVQVESLAEIRHALGTAGFESGDIEHPGGDHGPETSWASDPDGYRIELTQWPAGHPLGVTALDFSTER